MIVITAPGANGCTLEEIIIIWKYHYMIGNICILKPAILSIHNPICMVETKLNYNNAGFLIYTYPKFILERVVRISNIPKHRD